MWNSLRGYVIIQVQGMATERFLNHALGAGVRLAGVRRTGHNTMILSLPAKDFLRKLPAVRRKCRCRIRILKRYGAAFIVMRALRRRVLLVGSLLAAATIAFASTRVWRVEIAGSYRVPEAVVLRAVQEAGVSRGMARADIVNTALAKAVNAYDERIAWAGVSVTGVTLHIEIVEAQAVPSLPDESAPMDVIALRDGVIERVTALRGKASVQPGDAVRAGSVLIRGDISREEATEPLLVHAAGEVLARVWYAATVALPGEQEQMTRTGQTAPYRAMTIAGVRLFETKPPFDAYDIVTEGEAVVRNLVVPLHMQYGTCHALAKRMVEQPREALRAQATFEAELAVLDQVPRGARILEKRVEITWPDTGGVRATAQLCTLEDIGAQRPIEGGAAEMPQSPEP